MNSTDYDFRLVVHYRYRKAKKGRASRQSYPLYHGLNEHAARLDLLKSFIDQGFRVLKIEKRPRGKKQ